MNTLIHVKKIGKHVEKILEETSVFKDYLFQKYNKMPLQDNEAILLFNESGGILHKGVQVGDIKPIMNFV